MSFLLYVFYFYLAGVAINLIWTIVVTIQTWGNEDGFTGMQTAIIMMMVNLSSWFYVYYIFMDFIRKLNKEN